MPDPIITEAQKLALLENLNEAVENLSVQCGFLLALGEVNIKIIVRQSELIDMLCKNAFEEVSEPENEKIKVAAAKRVAEVQRLLMQQAALLAAPTPEKQSIIVPGNPSVTH